MSTMDTPLSTISVSVRLSSKRLESFDLWLLSYRSGMLIVPQQQFLIA